MTVKTQSGKVALIDGKVSCECCAGEIIPCDSLQSLIDGAGGQGFFRYTVELGPALGTVNFCYEPFDIPDRFVVLIDDDRVVDTGFVGTPSQEYQAALDATYGEGAYGIRQLTTPIGIPECVTWNKNSVTETARVIVIAPLSSTGWEFSMSCVEAAP
jgi:hypothetical protein